MKIQQPQKPQTRTKVDVLFERANILSKKPARKIGSKIKKKPTFLGKLWPKLVNISCFLAKSKTINPHITDPPLAYPCIQRPFLKISFLIFKVILIVFGKNLCLIPQHHKGALGTLVFVSQWTVTNAAFKRGLVVLEWKRNALEWMKLESELWIFDFQGQM